MGSPIREPPLCLLSDRGDRAFTDLCPFSAALPTVVRFNSLSQTLLKLTCPGVPDLYQSHLRLPADLSSCRHLFSGKTLHCERDGRLRLADVFESVPVAALDVVFFTDGYQKPV